MSQIIELTTAIILDQQMTHIKPSRRLSKKHQITGNQSGEKAMRKPVETNILKLDICKAKQIWNGSLYGDSKRVLGEQ